MKLQRALVFFAAVAVVAVFALAGLGAGDPTTAQAQEAQAPPADFNVANGADTGTASLSWKGVGAAKYRAGWLAVDDYLANPDNYAWLKHFGYADTTEVGYGGIRITGLQPGKEYWFIVGRWHGNSIAWSEWERLRLNPAGLDDDAITRGYIVRAIARYQRDGLEATVAYHNRPVSHEGERWLRIIDTDTQEILASGHPWQVGRKATDSSIGGAFQEWVAAATEAGYWVESLEVSATPTGETPRPRRDLFIRHGNLVFNSGHYVLEENIAEVTQDYVNRAIQRYEREGREATIAYYTSTESVEGPFYLFLMDENDIYLAHPISPHLIGTDIKAVKDSSGYELGKEIARATEGGHWVYYLWPNPVTGVAEPKSAWVIRHDGLIFASGYYTPDPNADPPAWRDADPGEYTVTYVENAIARYQRDGRESMATYYNSVASFEDQWYLFVIGPDDIYVVHPLFPGFIGAKDIKDVVDSSGYELGKEIAKATADGHWVEYLWPHPRTLAEAPKRSYVVRHDGLIFASGYYPQVDDPDAYTVAYTQAAIDRYNRDGLEATVAYYNSPTSVDRQWYLSLFDQDGVILTSALFPFLVGRNILTSDIVDAYDNEQFREDFANTTEAGHWIEFRLGPTPLRMWAIRHDGYVFLANYIPQQ